MTDQKEGSTQEVLSKLRNGDRFAFEKIYRQYSGPVFVNILKMVKDRDTAEDLLHDVFIRAWQYREDIDIEKSFKAYLYKIARNLVLNYFRRASLETQVAAYIATQQSELYKHVEESLEKRDLNKMIQNAVSKLPPKRRQAFTLCKIEGKSYQEAAELLGCSVSAINAHIVKATKSIQTELSIPFLLPAIVSFVFR